MRRLFFMFLCLSFIPLRVECQPTKVIVITLDGAINPAASDYIQYGIQQAVKDNAVCLVLRLNTPGGLLTSTREIVSGILQSPIPVVVYVAPQGSRAASAGVFVTLSANIAAMAPGTNIGAAHPVMLEGKMDSTMMEKVTNDAVAFIKSISEKRNRNVKWAEEAVRKSVSIPETEALKLKVIDLIANNMRDLLNKIDGKVVTTDAGNFVLHTKNSEIYYLGMSFQQKMLGILSDPNIAYILMMLGFYGLLFELYNPGSIFPGVVGVISLVLAFYSFQTLPVNFAGLVLIIFGIILFILEIKIVSHGLLTVGGVICLLLGSLMLINPVSSFDVIRISWQVIAIVIILTFLFFTFAIGLGIKAQRRKPATGKEGLINETGEAITDLIPEGSIKVHGEIWKAESTEGNINKGEKIIVTGMLNLKLIVRKV